MLAYDASHDGFSDVYFQSIVLVMANVGHSVVEIGWVLDMVVCLCKSNLSSGHCHMLTSCDMKF